MFKIKMRRLDTQPPPIFSDDLYAVAQIFYDGLQLKARLGHAVDFHIGIGAPQRLKADKHIVLK